MTRYIIAYIATAVAFLGVDSIWLSIMANRLYRPAIGDMMADSFRPAPALAFYALFVLGLVVMAVAPALREQDWHRASINGALLGFFAYATYDLTNQATLKQWSTTLTLADMAWGTILSCICATVGYAIASWLSPKIGC
jgi:uncharacterized membrane protein